MQPSAIQHVLRRSGQIIRQATGISQFRTFTTSKMVLIKVIHNISDPSSSAQSAQ